MIEELKRMATNRSNGSTNGQHIDSSVQMIINDFLCAQLALKGYNWTPNSVNNHQTNGQIDVANGQIGSANGQISSVNGQIGSANGQIGSTSGQIDSTQRTKIGEALRSLGRTYCDLYEEDFAQMCERLEVIPSTAFATFNSVSNELFIEGIKWSHIVTYLVFGSEFAYYSVQKGFPDCVNEVSHWLALFVSQNLLRWINDNGGWEGVIEFARDTIGQPEGNGHWRFGLKDIICGAAGALGVLTLGLFLTTKS